MSDVPLKKKRRRRMATPPPDEDGEKIGGDLYDNQVINTLQHIPDQETVAASTLKSMAVDPTDEPVHTITTPEKPEEKLVEEKPVEISSPESDVELINDPDSPPPPMLPLNTKRKRLGRGVRAALDKLEVNRYLASVSELESSRYDVDSNIASSVVPSVTDVKIRVKLSSGTRKYTIKETDPMLRLRERLATDLGVSLYKVVLFCKDDQLSDSDTPKSKGLTIADTVECLILEQEDLPPPNATVDDKYSIKVQGRNGIRDVLIVKIGHKETLERLMNEFAKFKAMEVSSLSFYFDGDRVAHHDTPDSLDMDDGDCIDVSGY